MATVKYYSQIDSIRALAALAVVNLHWLGKKYLTLFGIENYYDWGFGKYGVQLFFVLSGFLITEILIRNRDSESKSRTIFNFYVRRILRLLPIYYLFILFLVVVKNQFVVENIVWYLTYTVNIKFYLTGGLVDTWSNHLWTLSIEEQFYIIFPLILLSTPKRAIYLIPILFIILGVVTKLSGQFSGRPVHLLMLAQTDMLGVGALLALLKHQNQKVYQRIVSAKTDGLLFLTMVASVLVYYFLKDNQYVWSIFPFLLMTSFGLLVAKSANGFGGVFGRFLELRWLRQLGKISYGLYIYHKIVPLSLIIVLNKLNIQIEHLFVYYGINIGLLILISHFSWVLIESPILKLKSRFRYKEHST